MQIQKKVEERATGLVKFGSDQAHKALGKVDGVVDDIVDIGKETIKDPCQGLGKGVNLVNKHSGTIALAKAGKDVLEGENPVEAAVGAVGTYAKLKIGTWAAKHVIDFVS
jgi:hypothetical protein